VRPVAALEKNSGRHFFFALVMRKPATFVKPTHIVGVLIRITEQDHIQKAVYSEASLLLPYTSEGRVF
jgi:hypothetical protein